MAVKKKSSMIVGQSFRLLSDLELPQELADCALSKCTFSACTFGTTAQSPDARRTINNVKLSDCRASGNCSLGPVILTDVELTNLSTNGLCIVWGAVYERVRIVGDCGKFMSSALPSPVHSQEKQSRFRAADLAFYADVDWALDISEGNFEELDIRNIPARLVRRDPETQVVVRRDRVASTEAIWTTLDLSETPWMSALRNVLLWGVDDRVLVAPRRSRNFARWLRGLRLLQEAGVAEVD